MLPKLALRRLVGLILIGVFAIGCGSAPTAPDTSRDEMEQRQDEAFRELK